MVTTVPAEPLVGVKPETEGGAAETEKFDELRAEPAKVSTVIGPDDAEAGTIAVIFADESTVKPASTPLNRTLTAPTKFEPSMVTAVPVEPLGGSKPVIAGGKSPIVNGRIEVAVPAFVVMLIGPLVAPWGTSTDTLVEEFRVKLAGVPLN